MNTWQDGTLGRIFVSLDRYKKPVAIRLFELRADGKIAVTENTAKLSIRDGAVKKIFCETDNGMSGRLFSAVRFKGGIIALHVSGGFHLWTSDDDIFTLHYVCKEGRL
jgi:hypothetical protein